VAAKVVTPEQYRRFTLWAIVALAAIVVTGAAVRLTGSGLGCSDWPRCEAGSLVPDQGGVHSAIEFGNRAFSIVPAVAVGLTVWGALRRLPFRRDLLWWSWGLVAGVAAQILLGRFVVEADLLPSTVIAHFLLSMVLLWNAVVLHYRAQTVRAASKVARVPNRILHAGRTAVAVAAYVLVSGTVVTGTGPHSGDISAAERLPYYLPDVARLHSVGVIVLCLLVLSITVWVWPRPVDDPVRRATLWLLGAIVVQGAIGYTQYFTGVPALLVAVHVLGSIIVWIAVLWFHLSLFDQVEGSPSESTRQEAVTSS
jgi:heme a synthase